MANTLYGVNGEGAGTPAACARSWLLATARVGACKLTFRGQAESNECGGKKTDDGRTTSTVSPLINLKAGHSHAKKAPRSAGLSTDVSGMEGNISTVLIVINDDSFRAVLRALFEQGGGIDFCVEARSGAEALDKTKRLLPNLVILDFSTPEMNVMQLTQELREILPRLPIFMLTADCNLREEAEALSCGIDAVFSKLDDLEALLANARAVCGIKRQ